MERVSLDSTSVTSAGYDAEGQILEIEFQGGRVYQYRRVPPGVHAWLVRTPNKGAFISRMIANKYPYEEVGQPAAAEPRDLAAALRASIEQLDPDRGPENPP